MKKRFRSCLPDKGDRKGFTLFELLIVVGVLAIVAVVVILVINPAELFKQGWDANRISGLNTLDRALSLYYSDALNNPDTLFMGSSSVIYVSLPDPLATTTAGDQCQGLGLPTLQNGWVYHCAASSTYLNTNGTGWVPINFTSDVAGRPIAALPRDPSSATSSCLYYTYTASSPDFEITARLESTKYQPLEGTDGGAFSDLYEKDSSLSLLPFDIGGGIIRATSKNNSTPGEYSACNNQSIGQLIGGTADSAGQFGIAYDASSGITYVVNWGTDNAGTMIEIYDSSGNYISSFGSSGTGNGQFTNPFGGIAIAPTGNLYISDSGAGRVEIFDANGNYLAQFGSQGSGNGQFNGPAGIAISSSTGNVYVADYYNSRIEVFNASGTYLSQFGGFQYPQGIAIDANGNLWVVDKYGQNVREYTPSGALLFSFGTYGSGNGQLDYPTGIAIGPNGNLYVADSGNNRVEVFNESGTYLSQFSIPNPQFLTVN